jgi:hypothetical protein
MVTCGGATVGVSEGNLAKVGDRAGVGVGVRVEVRVGEASGMRVEVGNAVSVTGSSKPCVPSEVTSRVATRVTSNVWRTAVGVENGTAGVQAVLIKTRASAIASALGDRDWLGMESISGDYFTVFFAWRLR